MSTTTIQDIFSMYFSAFPNNFAFGLFAVFFIFIMLLALADDWL